MQVSRIGWMASAALLVLAGCSRSSEEPPPPPAPMPERPASAEPAPSAPVEETRAPEVEAPAQPEAAPAAQPPTPGEIRVGMSREALVAALGACALRTHLTPSLGPGTQTVESFQAKDEACVEQLGRRHFIVRGDQLHAIESGLRELDRPTPPPRDPNVPR